ncbi:hypothetical protein B0T25DRAFT_218094 [Lasiosphaeria hispida]|uniref:Secreted protein n=1 Tax=Lasiosphaeria hispida TaxID=260671 RepID=A0AAJ0HJ25_9PEZI|nr:hypothetical protein B0T25DRAFT_218094 [Lasiosphaeria hispida]
MPLPPQVRVMLLLCVTSCGVSADRPVNHQQGLPCSRQAGLFCSRLAFPAVVLWGWYKHNSFPGRAARQTRSMDDPAATIPRDSLARRPDLGEGKQSACPLRIRRPRMQLSVTLRAPGRGRHGVKNSVAPCSRLQLCQIIS